VVIGIIVLLMGLLMPALTRARQAGNATKCMNNLRQIGNFYYIYANNNGDRIPLGTTAIGKEAIDVHVEDTDLVLDQTFYHTAFNHYVYYGNRPSAAAGAIVASGLIYRGNASLLYCPSEGHGERFEFDSPANRWPAELDGDGNPFDGQTLSPITRISYAVRPVRRLWGHPTGGGAVTYPSMPKLVKQKSYALMAELPQLPPANHGSEASPLLHVLYADGSVRVVGPKAYHASYVQYLATAPPYDPGVRPQSNDHCFNEANRHAETIWWVLDRQ
jgi:type II secretory pathway pseudopilin PulG